MAIVEASRLFGENPGAQQYAYEEVHALLEGLVYGYNITNGRLNPESARILGKGIWEFLGSTFRAQEIDLGNDLILTRPEDLPTEGDPINRIGLQGLNLYMSIAFEEMRIPWEPVGIPILD